MNKKLENIIYELNPVNDFKRFEFDNFFNKPPIEGIYTYFKNHEFLLHIYKPLIRGFLAGACAGMAYHYLEDKSVVEGISYGWAGLYFDSSIYNIRGILKHFSAQLPNIRNKKN
jgi:hypothetical protein